MKNKIIAISIFILLIPLISSAPTIIKSNLSLSIVKGAITLTEDGSAIISESIACTNITQFVNSTTNSIINVCDYFNFNKDVENLQIREIGNGTDIAILIEQLRKYNEDCTINKTAMFEDCKEQNRNLSTQVEILNVDKGYKAQFDNCNTERNNYKSNYDKANSDKTLFGIGGVAIGAGLIYLFMKSSGKIINQPKEQRGMYPEGERH